MATPIEICYASAGSDLIINTLEAVCSIWAEPITICAGFDDYVCGTEDSRTLTFTAMGFDEALPKRDNSAFQTLTIALDNTSGMVQTKLEEARVAEARVTVTYRRYLESDLTFPAERFHLSLLNRQYDETTATLTCGLFDLLGTEFPRKKLTANAAPGLIYV
ncbi:DUF1833 family protein [Pseudomonas sp. R5(2019)]|uniref:DUF1833 family protein n=1 Tax=Pseudomonas sp. R5(2019) TaxID=2697566 RepID=UPI001412D858|nr:DUF1833 family protein [Pseudomonas sp. R5(2019)]NBA95502.1 DUF1833 domain-containing protein [Pseudomonas sp. R5(2019)]